MKKFYLFALLMACALGSMMAGLPFGFPGSIIILRPVSPITPPTNPHPTIKPWSVTESAFTATLLDEELMIASESATGAVEIVIEGNEGVVYSNLVSMAPGTEVTVSLTNLAEGTYTLYIIIDDAAYFGEFQL